MERRAHDFPHLPRTELFAGLGVNNFNQVIIHEVHARFLPAFIGDGAAGLGDGVSLRGINSVVILKGLSQ